MDLEAVHVADDQQRRVFQVLAVEQQLAVGFASRSLCLPLYSQPKWPRIQTSAQPSPPSVFSTPRSKVYHVPVRVGLGRLGLVEQFAQVEEMLLAGAPLGEVDLLPLGDELLRGHAVSIPDAPLGVK